MVRQQGRAGLSFPSDGSCWSYPVLERGARAPSRCRHAMDAPATAPRRGAGGDGRPRDGRGARRTMPCGGPRDDALDGVSDAPRPRGPGTRPARPRRRWARGVPRAAGRGARSPALRRLWVELGDLPCRCGGHRLGVPEPARLRDRPLPPQRRGQMCRVRREAAWRLAGSAPRRGLRASLRARPRRSRRSGHRGGPSTARVPFGDGCSSAPPR